MPPPDDATPLLPRPWDDYTEMTLRIHQSKVDPTERDRVKRIMFWPFIQRIEVVLQRENLVRIDAMDVFMKLLETDLDTTWQAVDFRDRRHFMGCVLRNVRKMARTMEQKERERLDSDDRPDLRAAGSEDDPVQRASHFEELGRLAAAMELLDDQDRDILTLRFFEDASYAEMGKALGIPAGSVPRIFNRAINRLQEGIARVLV